MTRWRDGARGLASVPRRPRRAKGAKDLRAHRRTGFRLAHDGRLGAWPLELRDDPSPSYAVVCNDLHARFAFAVAGCGVALLPDFAIGGHLREGTLVRVLPEHGEVVSMTLLRPTSGRRNFKMRAFSKHIAIELRAALGPR